MAVYTWDAIYDRLKVDQGGLPNKSTQDMLDTFWTLAGYPDGTLGADEKVAFYESQGAVGDSLGDLEYDYWYRVGPNILAAKGAVFAIDAAQSISGEQWVLNRGSGGQVLRARYGSVGRAEIRNGVGFVAPSNSGNTPSVPDAANLRISGTLEVLGRFEGNTRPATTGYLAIKSSDGTYANRWYSVVLYNSGQLGLWCRDTAMNSVDKGSVSAIPSTTTAFWWKVNVNPATGVFNFYYAPDQIDEPTSWTDLGGTTGSFVGNAILTGSGGDVRGHHLVDGVQKRLMIRNAIGSGTVLDIDFTAQADLVSSFVASTGQTVTVTAANAVDTNDPLWLPWNGENYVYFPGANNNSITTTGSLSDFPTNGVQVEVDIDYGSSAWTSRQGIFWFAGSAAGSSRSVEVSTWATGGFLLAYGDGVVASDYAIFSASPLTGRQRWRFTADAATPARIYTAEYWNGSGWTLHQTKTDTDATAVTAIDAINTQPIIGTTNTAPTGRIYSVDVRDGALASLFNWRASDMTQTGGVSGGRTWTVNRASSGRKTAVVTRPIWLLGTDDYLEVADNDLLDLDDTSGLSAVIVMRQHGTQANFGQYLCKLSAGAVGPGWVLQHDGTASGQAYAAVSDGTNTVTTQAHTGAYAPGNLTVLTFTQDETTDRLNFYNNNVPSGTDLSTFAVGAGGNTSPLRIGAASPTAGFYADMELLAVGIFRRALSATEIAQIVTYYGAS